MATSRYPRRVSSTHSRLLASGSTKCASPTRTSSPSMIASVRGSRSVTVSPAPGRLAISIVPRIASTLRRTMSIPTPRPETSVTSRAVEKPGARMSARISASDNSRVRRDQSPFHARGAHRFHVQPAPVVADPDQHIGAGMRCRQLDPARSGGFPAARRSSGVSMP